MCGMWGPLGHCPVPPFAEGMTIPRYRPMRQGGNPFALAIWLGVWTPGGNLEMGYLICMGRLWVESATRPHVNVLPIERNATLINPTASPPSQPVG